MQTDCSAPSVLQSNPNSTVVGREVVTSAHQTGRTAVLDAFLQTCYEPAQLCEAFKTACSLKDTVLVEKIFTRGKQQLRAHELLSSATERVFAKSFFDSRPIEDRQLVISEAVKEGDHELVIQCGDLIRNDPKFAKELLTDLNELIQAQTAESKTLVPMIRALLTSAGVDVKMLDNKGKLALLRASHIGNSCLVEELLGAGADIHAAEPTKGMKKERCTTALHLGAESGHLGVVTLLLRRGANINALNCTGKTALYRAISKKHLEIARELIKQGADVDLTDPESHDFERYYDEGQTPLLLAVRLGLTPLISDLLLRANAAKCDLHGVSTLMRAAENGSTRDCEMLLHARNDLIHLKDNEGRTALHWAAKLQQRNVVEMLLLAGAGINERDLKGRTPLFYAIDTIHFHSTNQDHTDVYNFAVELIRFPALNIDTADNDGQTPLYLATSKQLVKIVRLLVHAGASITGNGNYSPLYCARETKNYDIIQFLQEFFEETLAAK